MIGLTVVGALAGSLVTIVGIPLALAGLGPSYVSPVAWLQVGALGSLVGGGVGGGLGAIAGTVILAAQGRERVPPERRPPERLFPPETRTRVVDVRYGRLKTKARIGDDALIVRLDMNKSCTMETSKYFALGNGWTPVGKTKVGCGPEDFASTRLQAVFASGRVLLADAEGGLAGFPLTEGERALPPPGRPWVTLSLPLPADGSEHSWGWTPPAPFFAATALQANDVETIERYFERFPDEDFPQLLERLEELKMRERPPEKPDGSDEPS
jgi:hypothetical protein